MRTLQALPLTLLAACGVALPLPAAAAPWCSTGSGGTNCGFQTHAQCLASVSGTGGFCSPNPAEQTAPPPRRSEPPRRPAAERPAKDKRVAPRKQIAPSAPPAAASAAPPAAAATVSPPAEPADRYQAARQLVLDGRYGEGIAALQALGFDDHPDVATYLGLANRKLGRTDTAKAWYAKALAADPDHVVTLMHAGTLLAELGDAPGARRHLARIEVVCRGCPEHRQLEQAIAAAPR